MKLGVLLVHGIGTESPEWAKAIIPKLQAAVLAEAKAIVPQTPPASADEILVIDSVYWNDVLDQSQRRLYERLQATQAPLVLKGPLWQKVWAVFKSLARSMEVGFVSQSIGDIVGYLHSQAQTLIHARVAEVLERVAMQIGVSSGKVPVTFVAHSLGTVVSSDYVYDQCKVRCTQQQDGFHDRLRLENLFTLGSPLALFSLQYSGASTFRQPIRVESSRGRWINIYDKDDPIGTSLRVLDSEYEQAVAKDVLVESGGYLVAHTRYFEFPGIVRIIARKLALDWVAANNHLPPEQLDRLYVEYDRSLEMV